MNPKLPPWCRTTSLTVPAKCLDLISSPELGLKFLLWSEAFTPCIKRTGHVAQNFQLWAHINSWILLLYLSRYAFFVCKRPSLASSSVLYFLGQPSGMRTSRHRMECCGSNTKVKRLKPLSRFRDKNSKNEDLCSIYLYMLGLYG